MKNIFLKLVVPIILITSTILVIFYVKGYRINFTENTLVQTGILHIETEPRASFYLTEDFQGRSPKIVTSIPEGEYILDIWLKEYHGIKYNIEIFAERSTPISVFLFKENPEKEIAETIQGNTLFKYIEPSRNNAFVVLEKLNEEKSFEILRYQTNTRFWQLGTNPLTLFEFSIGQENDIEDISFSPNGKNLLLTITGEDEKNEEEVLNAGKFVISLDTKTILAEITEIEENPRWSHDSESLFWNDEEGIKKINLKEPKLPTLIYVPKPETEILHYDAYTNGDIYVLTDEAGTVSLKNVSTNKEETLVIEQIHFQEEQRFLEEWKEQENIEYKSFTNSPQSTLFVGKPTDFLISKETQTITFNTEFASYMYDIKEDKYILINPYKTEFLSFSPDGEKLAFLCLEREKLGFFIFDKEINNYSIELGGGYTANFINKEICSDFAWHQNSQNIYYICEQDLYVTDIRTEYNLNLVKNFGNYLLMESNKKVVSIEPKEESLEIIEYTIN